MGAEFRDAKLAGSAQARAQALEGIQRRRQAAAGRPEPGAPVREEQTEEASMFSGEAPGAPIPPGLEEAQFRRSELTRERTRSGRREEMYNTFRQAAEQGRPGMNQGSPMGSQQDSGNFGFADGANPPIRPGISFGAGRATRVPEPGTPGYEEFVARMRGAGSRLNALRGRR